MDKFTMSNFYLITCNNILKHFYHNAKNISIIEIETGIEMPATSDSQEHFDSCLEYLLFQKMIVKINESGYEITKKGRCFYKDGGFS